MPFHSNCFQKDGSLQCLLMSATLSAQVLPSQCTIYKFDYGWGRLHFWLLEGEVTEQLQLLLNESPPKHDLWSTSEKRDTRGFLSASSHLLDCMNIESTIGKDPPMEHRLRQTWYFRKWISKTYHKVTKCWIKSNLFSCVQFLPFLNQIAHNWGPLLSIWIHHHDRFIDLSKVMMKWFCATVIQSA